MTSSRIRLPLTLAVAALLAGCGGSDDKSTSATTAARGYDAPAEVKSEPQNAARQALWTSYGLAQDYAEANGDFADPKTLAPEIGGIAGNPAKREEAAIYVAKASGDSLQLVTLALDDTLVTLTVSANGETAFNIGGTCDDSGCRD